jgi:hypothetical protein
MSIKKIEGTLVYVQVQKPVKAFVKAGTPIKPDEWKASVVVTDKSVIKAYQKYGKELDTLVSVKEVESSEFEEIYKCDLPEGAGDEVWVVTLRKSTELGKTGEKVPDKYKPRVFEKVGSTLVDVTMSKMPGNGSKGAISIDAFIKTSGGGALYLKNVMVTDMIEYIPEDSAEAGSEFDDDADSTPQVQLKQEPAKPAVKEGKQAQKAKAVKAKPESDLDESDLPF